MNYLDIIFVAIMFFSVVLAFLKGFVKVFVSIGSLILGIILGARFYDEVSPVFSGWVHSEPLRQTLGFLSIFFGILAIGGLTIFVLDKILKFSHLKWLDRLLGALFGIVRGWLICTVILLAMVTFSLAIKTIEHSELSPYVMIGTKYVSYLIPEKQKKDFGMMYRYIYEKWLEMKNSYKDKKM